MKNEIRENRLQALTVPCRYCNAPPQQECTNTLTNKPLTHLAAHYRRIKDADDGTPF